MKIVIVDYGTGNVGSVIHALNKINIDSILSNDRDVILSAPAIIIPGVGSFAHGMEMINKLSLNDTILEFAKTGKPILGICLGMQLLFESSEEGDVCDGLGLIKGKVTRLGDHNTYHIGWNEVVCSDTTNALFQDIGNSNDFYFLHSYCVSNIDDVDVKISTTSYAGHSFCSSVAKNNVYGVQFHPEKSSLTGLKLLRNFSNIAKNFK